MRKKHLTVSCNQRDEWPTDLRLLSHFFWKATSGFRRTGGPYVALEVKLLAVVVREAGLSWNGFGQAGLPSRCLGH